MRAMMTVADGGGHATLTVEVPVCILLLHSVTVGAEVMKAEVCNLDDKTRIDDTVRRFQVAMGTDVCTIEIGHSLSTDI